MSRSRPGDCAAHLVDVPHNLLGEGLTAIFAIGGPLPASEIPHLVLDLGAPFGSLPGRSTLAVAARVPYILAAVLLLGVGDLPVVVAIFLPTAVAQGRANSDENY